MKRSAHSRHYSNAMRKLLILALLLVLSAACRSRITSVSRIRVAPGEEFTIHGRALRDELVEPVAPVLHRCEDTTLEVLEWDATHIRVRVPMTVKAAVYDVVAFGKPLGAANRPRTNSIPIWVTAAPVPDSVTDQYDVQVKSFRARYGKNAAWETWMLDNRTRYQAALATALALPCPTTVAVTYATPFTYDPPWSSPAEHMARLAEVAEGAFPNYRFQFSETADPATSYAHAILAHPGTSSGAGGVMQLHYETIVNHEFGHLMAIPHHYPGSDGGSGLHFPPGENLCVMDRNSSEYCSACRTALNVPLDANNSAVIDAAAADILSRYPPGW